MRRAWIATSLLVCVGVTLVACGGDNGGAADAGESGDGATPGDGATTTDATATDASTSDAAVHDGATDASTSDVALHDGSLLDGSLADAVAHDGATSGDAGHDASADGGAGADASDGGASEASLDAGAETSTGAEAGGADASSGHDASAEGGSPPDASSPGPITGGPCASGAAGATALRIRFIDAGGTADVQWLVEGMPTRSNDSAGTYGYNIGFTPSYVDQFLAQGGVQLDSSDFIDLGTSTVGLASITSATLSVYGRSYDVSTNGSFNWQTFDGTGATPTDFVSNVPPYQWYSADMTTEIGPGESNVLIRIKAGPSSGALVVNEVEVCVVAQ